MNKKEVEINVYGAEQICAGCVNLPSARDTYEWLAAAIGRKFPNQPFKINYIDIYNPPADKSKRRFAKRVLKENMFYPVVLVENRVVGEGNPRLKIIFVKMEKFGYKSK